MLIRNAALIILALVAPSEAFLGSSQSFGVHSTTLRSTEEKEGLEASDLGAEIRREVQLKYRPGEANTEFAKRYKHLAGAKIKTVGEAFAAFTKDLGYTVNPLYKNMVTDIVGTTHLIVVNARFTRDPVWCLGILTSLELLLKNYPEKDIAKQIVSSLFHAVDMDEADVRAEAEKVSSWAKGKTRADVEAALKGEGDGPIAAITKNIKDDEFWMYSRYFGIGLLKVMEEVGIEMDKDGVYPIMEDWMSKKLGRSPLTACSDSDLYFKVKGKLDMMETMMKEIEIREKKRMAERLEEKAEQALRAADREAKMEAELEEEAKKKGEKVDA